LFALPLRHRVQCSCSRLQQFLNVLTHRPNSRKVAPDRAEPASGLGAKFNRGKVFAAVDSSKSSDSTVVITVVVNAADVVVVVAVVVVLLVAGFSSAANDNNSPAVIGQTSVRND